MSSDSSSDHKEMPTNIGGVFSAVVSTIIIFFVSQAITIAILLGYMAVFVQSDMRVAFFDDNKLAVTMGTGMIAAIALSVLSFKVAKMQRACKSTLKFFMLDKKPTLHQFGEVVVTYGLYFLTFIVATILLSVLNLVDVDQAQQLGIDQPTSLLGLMAIFVSLVVLPPIAEEILFRGYLVGRLKRSTSKVAMVAITSLVFGVAHLEYGSLNWIAAVDTMIFSVYLIYISQKHQSLYSSMLLHAIKNGIAFYVLFGRFY